MSRETEFLTRHKEDLTRGADLCRLLQRNVIEVAPRELHYLELRAICKRLEGTCRQVAHERGDDWTWLELGNHYVKVAAVVQKLRRSAKWMQFGQLAQVFETGIARVERLAQAATGLSSMSASPLLILPRHLRNLAPPTSGLIH